MKLRPYYLRGLSAVIAGLLFLAGCSPKGEHDSSGESHLVAPSDESVELATQASEQWAAVHPAFSDLEPAVQLEILGELERTAMAGDNGGKDTLWKTNHHIYGFVPLGNATEVSVQDARTITADATLKGKTLKITLDGIKVVKYPGGNGRHDIMFSFAANTQTKDQLVPVSYSIGVTAREGDTPAIVGKPIFVGLNAGTEGVSFKGATTNVNTEKDKTFFSILAGKVFDQGLRLLTVDQPALRPLAELTDGVAKELKDSKKGVPVQSFDLGLDFSGVATRLRLREGSFIIVQIPPKDGDSWKWTDWQLRDGVVVAKADPDRTIPFNHVILGVSRYEAPKSK